MAKEINRSAVLRSTNWGADIYAHILRQYYPGGIVMTITGRDCGLCRNPFAGGARTLHIWFERTDTSAELSDECSHHHDIHGAIPDGDTLANTFGSDYGNYSDGFRKAFHHETISYIRRKDREYVNIRTPRLSALLTGTPRQVHSLIPDAENGLFSRFIFYRLTTRPVWLDVFDSTLGQTHDRYFHTLGAEYHDYHRILSGSAPLTFTLTAAQQTAFNDTFRQYQDTWRHLCGDGFIATVRRMGLITFRTAMILSSLRIMDTGDIPPVLTCTEADFTTALTIAGILLQHSAAVYRELPGCSGTAPGDKPAPTLLHRTILESLPQEFDRATAARLADTLGLNPKSLDRIIKRWCEEGTLIKVSHGNYRKNQ